MHYAQTSQRIEQSTFPVEAYCKLQVELSGSQFEALQPGMLRSISGLVFSKAKQTIRYVWEDPQRPKAQRFKRQDTGLFCFYCGWESPSWQYTNCLLPAFRL
jgi:hypothetical protein